MFAHLVECISQIVKALVRLRECADWPESLLATYGEMLVFQQRASNYMWINVFWEDMYNSKPVRRMWWSNCSVYSSCFFSYCILISKKVSIAIGQNELVLCITIRYTCTVFSSTEKKPQDELLRSLFVLLMSASCVKTFKHLRLWNHPSDFDQLSSEAFWWRGNKMLRIWSWCVILCCLCHWQKY